LTTQGGWEGWESLYIRGKEAYKVYYKGNSTVVIVGKAALKKKRQNCKVNKLIALKQN
jgi:hypothetical protein